MKRVHVFICGYVQGVFFRAYIKELALKLRINGWVRNTIYNCIEAVFEGGDKDIKKMLECCHEGPVGSRVDEVNIKEENVRRERGFEIR